MCFLLGQVYLQYSLNKQFENSIEVVDIVNISLLRITCCANSMNSLNLIKCISKRLPNNVFASKFVIGIPKRRLSR